MEDPVATMEDPTTANRAVVMATDQAANLAPLGISREFSIEYGLGWVFRWCRHPILFLNYNAYLLCMRPPNDELIK